MFRFLLLVLIAGAVGLYFTNPKEEEVRAKVDSGLLSQLGPTGPATSNPVGGAVTSMLTDKVQGQVALARTDYYLASTYKVTVGGKQLPGCLIGIAKQVLPYDKC